MREDFKQMLTDSLEELEITLDADIGELSTYMAQRALYLSNLVGLPGFNLAVIAERDNVALEAGIQAVNSAGAVDRQLVGILQGSLRMAALALA